MVELSQEKKNKLKVNDKCLCGSDKKYKKCCLVQEAIRAEEARSMKVNVQCDGSKCSVFENFDDFKETMINLVKSSVMVLEEDFYNYVANGKSKFFTLSGVLGKKHLNNVTTMRLIIATNFAKYLNDVHKNICNNVKIPQIDYYNHIRTITNCTNYCISEALCVEVMWILKNINRRVLNVDTIESYMRGIRMQFVMLSGGLETMIEKRFHCECENESGRGVNEDITSREELLEILAL